MTGAANQDDSHNFNLSSSSAIVMAARELEGYAKNYFNGQDDVNSLVGFNKELKDIEKQGPDFARSVFKQMQTDSKASKSLLPDIEVVNDNRPGEADIDMTLYKGKETEKKLWASADQGVIFTNGQTSVDNYPLRKTKIESDADGTAINISDVWNRSDHTSRMNRPCVESHPKN